MCGPGGRGPHQRAWGGRRSPKSAPVHTGTPTNQPSRPTNPLFLSHTHTHHCACQVLVNDGLEEAYAELKETAKAWYPQLAEDEEEAKTPTEA